MKASYLVRKLTSIVTFAALTSSIFLTTISTNKSSETRNTEVITKNLSVNFGGEPAQAWWQNVNYKISSISNQDRLNFCKSTFPKRGITSASYNGDAVICYFPGYPNAYYRNQREVCEYKHPGYNTWLNDGGTSCYDYYCAWR
jgi:hypothetical protein